MFKEKKFSISLFKKIFLIHIDKFIDIICMHVIVYKYI